MNERIYNFNPGPAVLPEDVLKEVQSELLNFHGTGMSILEISHRAPAYDEVHRQAKADIKELMGLGDDYDIIFTAGGASQTFALIPLNFATESHPGSYALSGSFSQKAYEEAVKLGVGTVAASTKEENYVRVPRQDELNIAPGAAYLHICLNNTIYGTEWHEDFDVPVPLVADMSSDIFSRVIDPTKYALIYAGAQKNLSMAGVTLVIVRNDVLGKVTRPLPTMIDYRTHIDKGSMFNTPPVVPIFTCLQTLRWIKAQGGVAEMERRAHQRAQLLYGEIDRNSLFRGTVTDPADRSYMNVCFVMAEGHEALESEFLSFATARGMHGIKGHRSVGGFRASIYNAMPLEGVQALVETMQAFEAQHRA